jgi:phage-related protein
MNKSTLKLLKWMGDSHESVCAFSDEARGRAGGELLRVQYGAEPTDWKPMDTVGPGTREIRIRMDRAYRVLYVAKFAEAIYVLHAFVKKTPKTSKADIDLAKIRYKEVVQDRRRK